MESAKKVSIRIIKFLITASTLLAMIGIVLLFKTHIEVLPYHFKHDNEIILLLSMYICYLWSDKYKMKKVKVVAMIGIFLGIINLVGFRLINFMM